MGGFNERVRSLCSHLTSSLIGRLCFLCVLLHFTCCFRVSVGTRTMFCAEGCTAVIDTGSSYITGPASSVSVLMETIGADLDESGVSLTCSLKFNCP